jgi:hypothetical protein
VGSHTVYVETRLIPLGERGGLVVGVLQRRIIDVPPLGGQLRIFPDGVDIDQCRERRALNVGVDHILPRQADQQWIDEYGSDELTGNPNPSHLLLNVAIRVIGVRTPVHQWEVLRDRTSHPWICDRLA